MYKVVHTGVYAGLVGETHVLPLEIYGEEAA